MRFWYSTTINPEYKRSRCDRNLAKKSSICKKKKYDPKAETVKKIPRNRKQLSYSNVSGCVKVALLGIFLFTVFIFGHIRQHLPPVLAVCVSVFHFLSVLRLLHRASTSTGRLLTQRGAAGRGFGGKAVGGTLLSGCEKGEKQKLGSKSKGFLLKSGSFQMQGCKTDNQSDKL